MIKVLPSTNPCPENGLLEYAEKLYDIGVEYLHCDVMDGRFVENTCLDIDTITNIRNNCGILLDVHLMVAEPWVWVKECAHIPPSIITIHYESPKKFSEFIKMSKYLHEKEILFGVAIKPGTPVDILAGLLDYIDLILVMSVEPGKSGQSFIPESLEKIKAVKDMIAGRDILIEVDGGINADNYASVADAGADFLVMGNAMYTCSDRKALLGKIDKHYK